MVYLVYTVGGYPSGTRTWAVHRLYIPLYLRSSVLRVVLTCEKCTFGSQGARDWCGMCRIDELTGCTAEQFWTLNIIWPIK